MPEIEPIAVSSELLSSFTREREFTNLSFSLLREVTHYCIVLACLLPKDPGGWDRDRAILCGQMVRLSKLLHGVLGYGSEDRRELVSIISRCAFETAVNICYLIENFDPETLRNYRLYSLRHERRLRDEILANIKAREGKVLHIENRMLASIDKAFLRAGIRPAEVDPDNRSSWGGRSIYNRAKAVGLDHLYLSLFSGGSHAVHGNWQDLIDYHLQEQDGIYLPYVDFHRSRPQLFEALGIVVIQSEEKYFGFVDPSQAFDIGDRLQNLAARIRLVAQGHEDYLRRNNPEYGTTGTSLLEGGN